MFLSLCCSASEMTYIVSSGALNSTHSLTYDLLHNDAERRSRSFFWWRTPATGVGPKARRRTAMSRLCLGRVFEDFIGLDDGGRDTRAVGVNCFSQTGRPRRRGRAAARNALYSHRRALVPRRAASSSNVFDDFIALAFQRGIGATRPA